MEEKFHAKSKTRILLIEDDADLQEALRIGLTNKGYSLGQAYNAEMALKLLKEQDFDIILLDNWLPGMAGLTALTVFPKHTSASIIVMSGNSTPEMETDALHLGAKSFLLKPTSMDKLIQEIESVLRGKRAQ